MITLKLGEFFQVHIFGAQFQVGVKEKGKGDFVAKLMDI
jgi:hypothetical protein